MSRLALGFDVGLSGVRAALVREDGTLVASARRGHRRARMGDGVGVHDPRDWLEGLAATSREAAAAAGDEPVSVIGVAALGPAPVLVDERLRALTDAPLFGFDRRAEPQRARMVAGLSAIEAAATLDNALPKLAWWVENDRAAADEAAWALDATGFLVGWLTGVPVMDTVTAMDYKLGGVEPAVRVPRPIAPDSLAGALRPDAATQLGLPAGVPVAAGTYDSFVDLAAAGVRSPGDAGIVLGSTMIVCRASERAEARDGLGVSAYPGDGQLIGGWTLSGGMVLDWAAASMGGGHSQPDLAEAAAAIEPGRLLALPYLAGERTPVWDPRARGALLGLASDSRPHDVYRAFVDALALVVRDHTERLEEALGPCSAWRVTGGGTRNRAWLQATADAVGATLELPADAAEAVGPALLALRALGIDPERPPALRIEPDPARGRAFDRLLPAFRELNGLLAGPLRALTGAHAREEPRT